jgi:hypothetical protein
MPRRRERVWYEACYLVTESEAGSKRIRRGE